MAVLLSKRREVLHWDTLAAGAFFFVLFLSSRKNVESNRRIFKHGDSTAVVVSFAKLSLKSKDIYRP